MMKLIKTLLRFSGPLNMKKIKRQLNHTPKVKEKMIGHGTRIEMFDEMKVYHIQEDHDKHLIYLHGGAYIHGLNHLHFRFCKSLSKHLSLSISLIDYPLLPKGDGIRTTQLVLDYLKTLDHDYYLMGDSAGGGLALGLIHAGIRPLKTVLLSPWLDVSMSNPNIQSYIDQDYILDYSSLKLLGENWARQTTTIDPIVSPIYGHYQDTKILMIGGAKELFVPDFRKMSSEHLKYIEYENMFHDFALFTHMGLKEADASFKEILSFLQEENQII